MNSDILAALLKNLNVQYLMKAPEPQPKPQPKQSPAESLRFHTLPTFFHNVEKAIVFAVKSGRFEATINHVTDDPKLQQAISNAMEPDGFRVHWVVPVSSDRSESRPGVLDFVVRW